MLRGIGCAWVLGALAAMGAPQGCVGSLAVANFRLSVAPPGGGPQTYVPIRQVNNVAAGARIRYQPLELPPELERDAAIALVMVPKAANRQITVLEPRSVVAAAEWVAPFSAEIALLVFAPRGLDEKRLTNLVTTDESLVASLADYADQTAELEAGLEALNTIEDDLDDELFRPATPAERALLTLVRALNPAVSSYNPLGAGRRASAATLMGRSTDMFFENAGGFVPGGGILPTVKSWLMPDTEFRAVYGKSLEAGNMALCAQLQPRSRNKMAYLWAYRLNAEPAPAVALGRIADAPIGIRSTLPLRAQNPAAWSLLERAYDWTLAPEAAGMPPLRVAARVSAADRLLHLDLREFAGAPGAYRIEAKWDWETIQVGGILRLHNLGDPNEAQVTLESQDRLITGVGPVDVELAGQGLLFIEKASLRRPGSARQIAVDVPAARSGPPNRLTLELDTDTLRPGAYSMVLTRVDGVTGEVPFNVLPPLPKIGSGPLRVNLGERGQTVVFTGSGLERIESMETEAAEVALKPAAAEGSRREATIRLRAGAKAGDMPALAAKVSGMSRLLRFPGLLQIAGARPRILDAQASLPRDLAVTLRQGELPAGSYVSFAVRTEPAGIQPAVTVQCAEPALAVAPETLRAGEKRPAAQWTSAGEGAWFLSLDPGVVGRSGCTLQAAIETEDLGKSDAFVLGKVVRLPRIERMALTAEKAPEGFFGALEGFDLETIEKTGWNAQMGIAAPELPRPVAGGGARQTLRITVPWPSPTPKAPLYVWLRGESEGRATRVTE